MTLYVKLNRTEAGMPVFFGIDGTDVGLKAVRDSKLAGTVYNDKEGQAEAMAKLAAAIVTGGGGWMRLNSRMKNISISPIRKLQRTMSAGIWEKNR